MSFHTIQALHYVSFLDLAGPITMVEQIGLHLATDQSYTRKFIQDRFGSVLSGFQIEELLRHRAHLIFQAAWVPTHLVQATAEWSIRTQIQQSMLFLQSLWLVKDNSVNASEVYFTTRKVSGGDIWTLATPPLWFFTADCQLRETSFSKGELDEAIAFYRASSEDSPQAPYDAYRPAASAAAVKSRIGRGLLAIRYARAAEDIGLKCAFYCVSFEALLSTDRDAIAHRIAERTAILIGSSADKLTIYRDIKKLYDGRSKVLHGCHLSQANLKSLFERVARCDDYLRRTLRRLLLEPELKAMFDRDSKVELDDYFLQKLLPGSPTVLPDHLCGGLHVIFCGTAAGDLSAQVEHYYAGPGNGFWMTLHAIGLAPRLGPEDDGRINDHGIGLTDLVKCRPGSDADLLRADYDVAGFRKKIRIHAPAIVAFNGLEAARQCLGRQNLEYGRQPDEIHGAQVWVLPSTSGSARGKWSDKPWRELAVEVQRLKAHNR